MDTKLKYYKELDGVRAIAAIMVMVYHFFQHFENSDTTILFLRKISLFGKTGVSLFFVLSGFLITRILLSQKGSKNYFKSFYIRRALRIFPLYYFYLIIFYFGLPFIINGNFVEFSKQIWNWIFLQNVALTFNWNSIGPLHYWSLAIEEHFYLFWPFLVYFLPKKNLKQILIFFCFVAIIARYWLIQNNYQELIFTFARLDELSIGSLIAIFEIENKLNNLRKKTIFFFIILTFIVMYLSFKNGDYSNYDKALRYFFIGLWYGSILLILITNSKKSLLQKICKLNLSSYTGKISYGLYVYHPLIYTIVYYYFPNTNILVQFVLSFSMTYFISTLSYYYFEKKFIDLKSKFLYK